jgi:hypothetical protein
MSHRIGTLRHPGTGLQEPAYAGFSWPAFFFGAFWYAAKGMWGMAILSFIVSMFTFGIAWFLVFPFMANRQLIQHLGAAGYVLEREGFLS